MNRAPTIDPRWPQVHNELFFSRKWLGYDMRLERDIWSPCLIDSRWVGIQPSVPRPLGRHWSFWYFAANPLEDDIPLTVERR